MEKPRVKWVFQEGDRRGDALPGTSSTYWIGPCSTPSTRNAERYPAKGCGPVIRHGRGRAFAPGWM